MKQQNTMKKNKGENNKQERKRTLINRKKMTLMKINETLPVTETDNAEDGTLI